MAAAHDIFRLTTVVRVLPGEVELAEALGFPEISALGDSEAAWRAVLQAKAKQVLEAGDAGSALSLHRRQFAAEPVILEVEIPIEAPKRTPAWQEPVRLRLPVVRWVEEDELHRAYVPALGILVFAPREALLEERIRAHVRLVLLGRRKKVGLKDLAQLIRAEAVRVGKLELTAKPPPPAALLQRAEQEQASMLETLAEELPPHVPRHPPGGAAQKPAPAREAGLRPQAFEMEDELKRLADLLAGAHRRSVLLVGPSGAGKTALVRELARRRRDFGFGHTPFWSTSGARLMTGPSGFGMWQERCQQMCREAAKSNVILHLGNLAELLEVGKAQRGQQSVGGFLRPRIARGEILTLAECTPEQVSAIERGDPHLLGAFAQLAIPERTAEQTRAVLRSVFEAAEGKLAPEQAEASAAALDRLHQLHSRYALYSANPGRPIRFLRNLLADQFPSKGLDEAAVTGAFSRETGLPPVLLDDRIPLDLEATRDWFTARLMGQPEAVAQVVELLAVTKARLARPKKPLASFLFIGPTGTGKTELAKSLAEFLFGDAARLARFDLNQFNDPAALQRLIGGPLAGQAEGLLTARVREQPFSVLLLDEFEKVDPGFFDLLLQILGDGRLTDAAGRVADFCNSVIVLTSNLGAEGFQRGPAGFRADGATTPDAEEHFTAEVRKFLRPEIFNRLDAVVPFRPLTPEVVRRIASRQLELLRQRDGFRLRPVQLRIEPEVGEYLARKGYDVRYGARPLKRAIERELLAPLAEALAQYSERQPTTARMAVREGKLRLEVRSVEGEDLVGAAPSGSATAEFAGAVTRLRRQLAKLKGCSATSALENQVVMGESLARLLAKGQWKSPEHQARLASLPKVRQCLEAIDALYDRARQLETELLAALYQREPLETAAFNQELSALEDERGRLRREVFRWRTPEPNEVVLAVFSEHRATLMKLAAAYHGLARGLGEVVALDYFFPPLGGRTSELRILREPPKPPERPFESAPEKAFGLVMHLRGDLFWPRFEPEAGLHLFAEKQAERLCLVESRRPPFAEYQPPPGVERPGGIRALGATMRRRFSPAADSVEDAALGERPWRGETIEVCLRALIEERLRNQIEGVENL